MSCRILTVSELGVLGRTILTHEEGVFPDFENPRVQARTAEIVRDLFRLSRANVRGFRVCYSGRHWDYVETCAPRATDIDAAVRSSKPNEREAIEAANMLHYNTALETDLNASESARMMRVMSSALTMAHRAMA